MEQKDFEELFINEAQYVDWKNQIVDIKISYWNYHTAKISSISLTAEDEDQFMKVGIILQSLYQLPSVEDLHFEVKHITQQIIK